MTKALTTTVTFQSDSFNKKERREYFKAYNGFGDDVCKFLIAKITASGIECDPIPNQGFGYWSFRFTLDRAQYLFTCRLREDMPPICEDKAVPSDGAWICDLEREKTGLLASIGMGTEVEFQALQRIHEILSANPAISSIRWHEPQQFNSGNEEAGTDSPR